MVIYGLEITSEEDVAVGGEDERDGDGENVGVVGEGEGLGSRETRSGASLTLTRRLYLVDNLMLRDWDL